MHAAPRNQSPLSGKENFPSPGAGPQPRLVFPAALLVIYWALYFIVGAWEKPYFYGFIYGMLSAVVFAICFLGWWWSNRTFRLVEKAIGFALIVAGAWIAAKFSHRSMNVLTLSATGFPLVVTAIVGWLALTRRGFFPPHRAGFFVVVALAWGSLLAIRLDGFDSTLHTQVRARWMPSAEERFLAQPPITAPQAPSPAPSLALAPANPATWSAFRGPNRDGVIHETHIATDWQTAPPQLLWKHSVGPAWSSVVVQGGFLYTQEQRGPAEAVVCYDSSTGQQLWVHEDATRFDEAVSGAGPRATPTLVNGHLFTLGATGLLNCLDAATGQKIWSREITADAQSKPPLWGMSSSPLVAAGNVIVYGGGEAGRGLLAYRADSGGLAWAVPAGQSSYSSPQLTTLAGTELCLMFHDFGLTAVDPATGKKFWEAGKEMKGTPRSGQPRLISDSALAVAVLDGPGISRIQVAKADDQWTVSPVWASKDLKPEFPDFVVHEGFAYGFDASIFCCLDLSTGKRAWKDGRYGRGEVILLADQSLLLVLSESGEAVLLAADPQQKKELGRFQALTGKTWNHPVVAQGRLYLRNAEEMACYLLTAN